MVVLTERAVLVRSSLDSCDPGSSLPGANLTVSLEIYHQKSMTNNKKSKRNSKKRGARGTGVSPYGSQPLLPANRRVKLSYCEQIAITEPAGGVGVHQAFSLNSLYDPNAGGVGHQPVGFDQISAMYLQHRVWACRAKVTFQNAVGSNAPISCVMFATFQPAVPSTPFAWFSQPYSVSGSCEALGGRSSCVLEKSFDIPAVLGITKQQYTSDMDFVGTSSGNPVRQAYLNVGFKSYAGVIVGMCCIMVQLEYTVEFSQPYALSTS